jgi:hypothetical protein
VLPSLLPSLTATPADDAIVWNASRRAFGLTYALNENRKTIARASYSMFASQLGATAAATISAIQYSAITTTPSTPTTTRWRTPTRFSSVSETPATTGSIRSTRTRLTTINQIGKYATPKTHEIMFGMDHELMPNFGISSTITYRTYNHADWNRASA